MHIKAALWGIIGCFAAVAAADQTRQPVQLAGDHITVVNGFTVERVFEVPRDQMGSWVSLTSDGQGRLIASDQGDKGLYLITPGHGDTPTQVEKLPVPLSSVQGITVHDDICYAVVNGPAPGLYRLTATAGDGRFDKAEKLITLDGGGEHGPHAVRVAPDGNSLFVICGNHTKLPENISRYRVPKAWGEDHLLPQILDPNGHANGITAPAGYIIRCDFDGNSIELYSSGYRNSYDMDFNSDGELFAYDADMEWDMGTPWYRPTRVCHATSGSEFGWRTGSGKWPTFYEDSLPAVADIGPGSPTGVEYGAGLKFPARYQRCMYLLDWTFGTMYALHLTPQGATYTGRVEEFLSGKPLPLTDATVGDDGNLYFATGGRNAESSLWRVRYTGDAPTTPVDEMTNDNSDARKQRHRYEAMHGRDESASDVRESLQHDDRFLRYAGRLTHETGNVTELRKLLRGELESDRLIAEAAIVVARHGESGDLPLLVEKLAQVDLQQSGEAIQSATMRAMALAAIRLGPLSDEHKARWLEMLRAAKNEFADYESPIAMQWYELMVYLDAPEIVELGVAVMERAEPGEPPAWGHLVERSDRYGGAVNAFLENMPPHDGMRVAFLLRNARQGWTAELVQRYFAFFPKAAECGGGNSYVKFLTRIREDAIKNLTPDMQAAAGSSISTPLNRPMLVAKPPRGPGREWTKAEALKAIQSLQGANFASGRNLYHATGCIKCHRFDGEGEAIGPDVSSVGTKFSKSDLLDSIINPSKTISDQYGSHTVYTVDGKVLTGRMVEVGDEIRIYTAEYEKPPIVLAESDIDEIQVSKTSQMPTKLIDELNEQELRDLIAYLLSSGNERAKYFRK